MTQIIEETQLDYCDVLLKPKRTTLNSREDVTLLKKFNFCNSSKTITGIPIMNANMGVPGTIEVAKVLLKSKCFATIHKFYTNEDILNLCKELTTDEISRLFVSCGVRKDFVEYQKLKSLFTKYPELNLCIDVANGYISNVTKLAKIVKKDFPNIIIMAGNVVTPEMFIEYKDSGISIVKVGIGNGSACSTREKTGIGRPQFSAIVDCCNEANKLKLLICADGGVNYPSDVCKALGVADFVMSGSFFAGTDEAAGSIKEEIYKTGRVEKGLFGWSEVLETKKFKEYFGMASEKADMKFYKTPKNKRLYKTYEGRVLKIPYTGSTQSVLEDILGGLSSALSYTNSTNLNEYKDNICFYKVNEQFNRKFL